MTHLKTPLAALLFALTIGSAPTLHAAPNDSTPASDSITQNRSVEDLVAIAKAAESNEAINDAVLGNEAINETILGNDAINPSASNNEGVAEANATKRPPVQSTADSVDADK